MSSKYLTRFISKLTINPGKDNCWLYSAGKRANDYGQFWDGTKAISSHRYSYENLLGKGAIPDGLYVCHSCDNRACVRHLFVGTAKENQQDMVAKGRSTKGTKKPVKRFSEKEKEQIRALSLSGSTQYAIAKLFNRSEPTISHVLKSKPKPKPSPAPSSDAAVMKETGKRIANVYKRLGEQLEREALRKAA